MLGLGLERPILWRWTEIQRKSKSNRPKGRLRIIMPPTDNYLNNSKRKMKWLSLSWPTNQPFFASTGNNTKTNLSRGKTKEKRRKSSFFASDCRSKINFKKHHSSDRFIGVVIAHLGIVRLALPGLSGGGFRVGTFGWGSGRSTDKATCTNKATNTGPLAHLRRFIKYI